MNRTPFEGRELLVNLLERKERRRERIQRLKSQKKLRGAPFYSYPPPFSYEDYHPLVFQRGGGD